MDLAPPSRPAAGITQAVYPVPRHLKTDLLDEVLLHSNIGSAIVFTRTKHGADRLTRQLQRRGHSVAALHGDRSQRERERALDDLKRGRVQVLVATDIASRGIDVNDISHVINYDVPHTPEDYVHRIGRTGRVEAVGDAFTLMSPEEEKDVSGIERFLGRSIPRVMIPSFDYRGAGKPMAPESRDRGPRDSGRGSRGRSGGRRDGGGAPAPGRGPARRPEAAGASHAAAGPDSGELSHGRRRKRDAPDRRRRRM